MSELYRIVKDLYPDMNHTQIDKLMGYDYSVICKVKNGTIPGLNVVDWLIKQHPDNLEIRRLHQELHAEQDTNRHKPKKGPRNVKATPARPSMNPLCRAMAGYLP